MSRFFAHSRDKNQAKPSEEGLWRAFAHGVRDNVVAEVAVQALRFGGMIVLARALLPGDFGIFRVLIVASTFATLVNEAGIPDALIQRKELTQEHQSTAWWASVLLAAIASAALYLTAPLIARAMAMPALTNGLRLLCIPILLEGTAVTANARLRRAMRFGALAAADVVAEASFLGVAVAALWYGYPRSSLALGLAARFAAHAIAVWVADPHVTLGIPRWRAARDLARFSASVCGGRFVVALSSNADFVLVGRLLGGSALGFYSMAWDLLRFIPDRLYKVAGRVTLPAFCRLQDDDEKLARAYLGLFNYLARIVLPIVACATIVAPELISFIYGPQWAPAATPMRLLAPGLILLGLRVGIGSIYYTKDHPSFDIILHTIRFALILIVVSVLAPAGLSAVSIGMSALEGGISILGQWMACVLIGLGLFALFRESITGLRLTLLCGLATFAGKVAAEHLGLHGIWVIVLIGTPPALTLLWHEARDIATLVTAAFGSGDADSIGYSEEKA